MTQLIIQNHGPLITATNFWDLPSTKAGKLHASVNAGAIRLLIPNSQRPAIEDMRAARFVICSLGPWIDVQHEINFESAVELLFEDGTDSPFAIHLTPDSFSPALPGEPQPGQQWIVSVWNNKKGKPHKAVERPCHWRRVASLPWLKPWG